jgi:lactosylceramide 4-alpha-galactosyltransferase
MLTVNKSVINRSSVPPERRVLKNLTVVNSTSFIRNTEKVSMNESGHATLTGLEAEPVPGEKHIMFIENVSMLNDSVTGKQLGLAITQRQACAIASPANTNPDTKLYLLYTCSVIGNIGDSPEYVKQMLSYPNVRIWKLVIPDYFKGTPLETWEFMGKVRSSNWPLSHTSDVLHFITLWKYGGTYLDMDFVMRQ